MSTEHDSAVHTPSATTPTSDIDSGLSRRTFLKFGVGGGVLLLGGGATLLKATGRASAGQTLYVGLAATDGWISLPISGGTSDTPGVREQIPMFPDTLASDEFGAPAIGLNVYSFGFRDVSVLNADYSKIIQLRGKVQHTSPVLWRGRRDGGWSDFRVGDRIEIELWNLGLSMRPDLADGHTVHWHGFPNQIPYYDGVPETSISVPVGRSFTYEFIPGEPGTYMYHCHFEDVEHVQMGMTGIVFVRPGDYVATDRPIDREVDKHLAAKTAYGINTGSEFDREYTWMITEIDLEEHWLSSHIQQPDWTEHRPDVFMINGRTFPDTLLPTVDNVEHPLSPPAPGGQDRLSYQPIGALVQGNVGERVLVRVANLGFRSHAIELSGLPMRIVGIDAKPTQDGRGSYADPGRPGHGANAGFDSGPRAPSAYDTNVLDIAPGTSYDVIIQLPDTPGTYPLGSRGVTGSDAYGGGSMRTHVVVHPGTLDAQTEPNF